MASNMSQRVRRLEDILAMLGEMSQRLRYLQPTMLGLMTSLSGQSRFAGLEIPGRCRAGLMAGHSFRQSWEEAVADAGLSSPEAEHLSSLGEVLGSADLESQLTAVACTEELLRLGVEEAREKSRRQGGLCRTMGVLGGATAAILLI